MTLGTLTLVTLTGSLVLLKLAFMGFALALLVRSLFPTRRSLAPAPALARLPLAHRPQG